MKRLASVSWNARDIKNRRPDWNTDRCEEFLAYHGDKIQYAMIEAGWRVIDKVLSALEDDK